MRGSYQSLELQMPTGEEEACTSSRAVLKKPSNPFSLGALVSLLLMFFVYYLLAGIMGAKPSMNSEHQLNSANLRIDVFVESLCPGSSSFIKYHLAPTVRKLGDVLDVSVVPYSKIVLDDQGNATLTCQHGVAECDANSYEQCAADIYKSGNQFLPFIECLYYNLEMGTAFQAFKAEVFESCASTSHLDWALIKECHDDDERAWKLQEQAFNATPGELWYFPWIAIDGENIDYASHVEDSQFDFFTYVCDRYVQSGGSHPAC